MNTFIKPFIREFLILLLVAITIPVLSSEKRQVVAVIDTGIPANNIGKDFLCKDLQIDLTGQGIQDSNGHGTNILGIMAKGINPKTQCLAMIKWYHNQNSRIITLASAAQEALTLNPVLVNMSISGYNFDADEFRAIRNLLEHSIPIVVAAGNDHSNLSNNCYVFPACYHFKTKLFHVVGAPDVYQGNYGNPITDISYGRDQCGFGVCLTGTSQATANVSARLLKEMQ